NLPQTRAAPVEATQKEVVLSIDRTKRVFIGDAEVPLADLEQKLKTNSKVQADKKIYLHADRDLAYGIVVEVMAAAQRAGIDGVVMITDPMGSHGRPKYRMHAPAAPTSLLLPTRDRLGAFLFLSAVGHVVIVGGILAFSSLTLPPPIDLNQ